MHSIIKNTRTNDNLQWVNDDKHLDDNNMRKIAAQKSRVICCICISHFYATYE